MIKAWRLYQQTEQALTTMATLLPLVDDLHSPAMRGRHWEELTRHCCPPSSFASSTTKGGGGSSSSGAAIDPTSPKFTFEDMMRYRCVVLFLFVGIDG